MHWTNCSQLLIGSIATKLAGILKEVDPLYHMQVKVISAWLVLCYSGSIIALGSASLRMYVLIKFYNQKIRVHRDVVRTVIVEHQLI